MSVNISDTVTLPLTLKPLSLYILARPPVSPVPSFPKTMFLNSKVIESTFVPAMFNVSPLATFSPQLSIESTRCDTAFVWYSSFSNVPTFDLAIAFFSNSAKDPGETSRPLTPEALPNPTCAATPTKPARELKALCTALNSSCAPIASLFCWIPASCNTARVPSATPV